ncbi:hypothetical protein WBG78_03575 [Chryseolinea sp. T2]|uniref:DUF6958 family protein n=1 Tax=Chryseolinea sp. T2 TaxID=3129255 RepID=UPI003078691A
MSNSEILLWRKGEARGPAISLLIYEHVALEILSVLQARKLEIDLRELIDELTTRLSGTFRGDIQWYILHVKEDLEQRGWIRTKVNRDHVQIVGLSRSKSATLKRAPIVIQ